MSNPLKLKTYTSEELKALIPALGSIIRPLPYKGRHIASCAHYLEKCDSCPLDNQIDLCDTVYTSKSDDIENRIDSYNKLFPRNFVKHHPEYFI